MNFKTKRAQDFIWFKIARPHRNGHGIHSPFLFDFLTHTLYAQGIDDAYLSDIFQVRNELLKNSDTVLVEDFGAGSRSGLKKQRKICEIAKISSSTPKYGKLLFRIVKYLKPEVVIELGTCLGMGTMALAKPGATTHVFTVEGSESLLEIAKQHFSDLHLTNIFAQKGTFDELLPSILAENTKFDILFIDGNHQKEAVLEYFKMSLPYAHDHSVIIFDDIRWSEGMFESWLEICRHPDVRISLDLFHWGMVFFNKKIIKQHFSIYY